MRVEDRVIPARFLVTLGHLVGVLLVFKTKSDNVYAGLSYDPTVAEVAAAKDDVHVRERHTAGTCYCCTAVFNFVCIIDTSSLPRRRSRERSVDEAWVSCAVGSCPLLIALARMP